MGNQNNELKKLETGQTYYQGRYHFYGLLSRSDDGKSYTGPFSPLAAAKTVSKEFKHPIHGLVRVLDSQTASGYDTLILKSKFKHDVVVYLVFLDVGTAIIPLVVKDPEGIRFTKMYEENVTEESQRKHRINCEIPAHHVNDKPVIDLSEKEWDEFITHIEDQKTFNVS